MSEPIGPVLGTFPNLLLNADPVAIAVTASIAAVTMLAGAAFVEYRNDTRGGDDTDNGAIDTVMELNPTEMRRLANTQLQFDNSMAALTKEAEPIRSELCEAEQQLKFGDTVANILPDCLGKYFGNAKRAQVVDNLRGQVRSKEMEIETVSHKASAIERQRSLMQRIARLEGSLPTLVERAANAGQEVASYEKNLEVAWSDLSLDEKIVYYIPTTKLRSIASNFFFVDKSQVEKAVAHNREIRRQQYLQSLNETSINDAYQDILKAMNENINLEGSHIHDRLSARGVLNTYSLACQLRTKAQDAISAIDSYRAADSLATAAELRADWSFGRSKEDQRSAENAASSARSWASLCLSTVSERLRETQRLSNRLENALTNIREYVGKIDTSGINHHRLDGASSSMWDYNWDEIFFGMNRIPVFNILHNISEWQNNERITQIVEEIGHSAEGIQGQLLEPSVRIFVKERSLLREQQPEQMVDGRQFVLQAITYLQSW